MIHRRSLFWLLATIPFIGKTFATAAPNSPEAMRADGLLKERNGLMVDQSRRYFPGHPTNFEGLKRWVDAIPDQHVGRPMATMENGENYVEFRSYGYARPDDVAFIEAAVVTQMGDQLTSYLSARFGAIYWRIPLEYEISDRELVAKFDDDGPDKDCLTDRRCVMDRNWKVVACYCRLWCAP